MTQLLVARDVSELAARAEQWLIELIRDHQAANSKPFSLALAGGSTPKALYQRLAASSKNSGIDWSRVLFLWGDERNVPADHADSNYRMVRESLLDKLEIDGQNTVRIPTEGGDEAQVSQAALQYENELQRRLPLNSDGMGVIDCVLLGMGDDVHTASLFPETAALRETSRWVVANYVPKLSTWRVTLTAPLINAAKQVAFFIAGSSKGPALNTLWHGPHQPELYPSQMIQPRPGELTFFVDKPAIENLSVPSNFRML
jgi:6-phosphogluconolactonase